MAVLFYYEEVQEFAFKKGIIKNWIRSLINSYNKEIGDINFIFCSDNYLLDLSQRYLKHDYYTDVIGFDNSEENIISGDIFLSIERIKDNAKIFGVSFKHELSRVMAHGVLHFLGFKDKRAIDKVSMSNAENVALSLLVEF